MLLSDYRGNATIRHVSSRGLFRDFAEPNMACVPLPDRFRAAGAWRQGHRGNPAATGRYCRTGGMIRHSVTEVIRMPKVEIYTQPWCPFCDRAMHILSTKSVEFQEIDAPHGSAEREEAKRRSGGRTTMPQIFIGGQHIGGCDELMALDRAGKLDPMLRAA
jgi:glutaredoxin 3